MSHESQQSTTEQSFDRLPGVFERWELGMMLEEHVDFYIEKAGATEKGEPLYALYEGEYTCKDCREQAQSGQPPEVASPR